MYMDRHINNCLSIAGRGLQPHGMAGTEPRRAFGVKIYYLFYNIPAFIIFLGFSNMETLLFCIAWGLIALNKILPPH